MVKFPISFLINDKVNQPKCDDWLELPNKL